MITVLFACVHSAGRSQMAAAFFNALADPTKVRGVAAGTAPATKVHPEVIATMAEVGFDLRDATPQLLTPAMAAAAHLLVTMGCGESCPVVPGLRRQDWLLPDPKGQSPEVVRRIRDDVQARVQQLVTEQGWARS
jgi:arsenate reductase